MALLPQFQSDDLTLTLMQNKWASILNPIISNPSVSSIILKNVKLSTGSNSIPHRLGRELQGWKIVRQRAVASIFDTQDNNQLSKLTLTLVSDAPVTVDIEVF